MRHNNGTLAAPVARQASRAGDTAVSSTDDQMIAEYLGRLETAGAILPPDRRAELIDEISTHIAEAMATQDGAPTSAATVLDRLGSPDDIVRAAAELGGTGSGAYDPGSAAGGGAGYGQAGPGQPGQGGWAGPPPSWQTPQGYSPGSSYPVRQGLGALEVVAIVLLLFGGFLAGIGWIVGAIMLWLSPRWRLSDKLLGTLVWPGGLVFTAALLGAALVGAGGPSVVCSGTALNCPASAGSQPGWLATALAIAVIVIAIALPILVTVRLVRQARRWAGQLPGDGASIQPL
jgi:hypothetical protein